MKESIPKDFELLNIYHSVDRKEGGMGYIYICNSEIDDELVVVKIPKPEIIRSNKSRINWILEGKNWLKIGTHTNIAKLKRIHFSNLTPQLVIKYYKRNLRDFIPNINISDFLKIAIGICQGMTHINSVLSKFVHKDLKPDNILIDDNRNALITDFGISYSNENKEVLDDIKCAYYYKSGFNNITLTDYSGTDEYASPEQFRHEILDTKSDIFSYGCILYEMATQKMYYYNKNASHFSIYDLQFDITEKTFQKLKRIICKCLEINKDNRYSTFDNIELELQEINFELFKNRIPTPNAIEASQSELCNTFEALIKYGDFDSVEKSISDLKEDEPFRYFILGKLYIKQLQFEKAISTLKIGYTIIENNANFVSFKTIILSQLALAYTGMNDYKKSNDIWFKVLEVDNKLAIPWSNIAKNFDKLEKKEDAIKAYAISISLSYDLITIANFVYFLIKCKLFDEAIEQLIETNTYYSNHPIIQKCYAAVYFYKALNLISISNKIDQTVLDLFNKSQHYIDILERINQLDEREIIIKDAVKLILNRSKE